MPVITPLFRADPLHSRGGWYLTIGTEHFNDNDDNNDILTYIQ